MNRLLVLFSGIIVFLFLCAEAQAQKKREMNFQDPTENFYSIQKRMNKHFRKHEKEEQRERKERAELQAKGKVADNEEEEMAGYELYKRWEYYMEPRVYPSGDVSQANRAVEEFSIWQQQNVQNKQGGGNVIQATTWQPLGPMGDPTGGNTGRINVVRFDPINSTGLWVCAPDGGLWSSANNGGSWATTTDNLSPIGSSDVVFDPTNSQIMYLATGDGDAGDTRSIGVLKSTNGGASWNTTGMVWTTNQNRRIYKLLINPLNRNVILAATNIGIYRTTNGGTSWSVVGAAGSYTDIEYKPSDTTTVYSVSTSLFGLGTTSFCKSTDGGANWSSTATGLPASANCIRFAIAVTPANSAYVYLLAGNSTVYGFYGFYRSTNSGTSFTSMATTPNLLGWSSTGNDAAQGGQAWYDLAIATSPTNANEVIVGGVNIWRTTNGGTNWNIFAHWTGTGAPYVHADVHYLEYKSGNTIYVGCDGGVFYTTNGGASFAAINGTMNISQMYKMGNSSSSYSLAIAGHQDNGTNLFTGGWNRTLGGDGMAAFIDWNNNQVMYGEQYNGSFNRTLNGGTNWSAITTGLTGTAPWNTPWHQDPNTANTLYAGRTQMFRSTNQGTGWSQIGTITGTTTVTEFAVAPSNSQVIYVIKGGTTAQGGNALWKTTNGGTNWTNVTGTLPVASAAMTWVAVDNTDANNVWVTFSGFSSGNKVYVSTDGGATWTNYSTGLPNLPVNCITYWNNTNDGLYVGCDVGVYYRDASQSSWAIYNTGLPNVTIADLSIYYPLGKLRAATYGRGMWEVDLVNNGAMAPIANFTADKVNICAGMTVNFSDISTFGPTGWSWIFQSGTPGTSTVQNPSIVYNTPGTYSVQLTATNGNGSDAELKTLYITVSPINALPLVEGFQGGTFPPTNWQNYDHKNDGLRWARSATVGKASTASTYYDNYNLDASGSYDELRTPKYNFSGFSIIKLYFDVAYAVYDNAMPQYNDSMSIVVSSDCGVTWNQVYLKGGGVLASTATTYSAAAFSPTAAQWRTDTVYLNAYAGQSNVMVAFKNHGHFGQVLYLDNINISGSGSGSAPNASFSVPGTKCSGQNFTLTDASTNSPTSWSWTLTGGSPATSTSQNPVVTYSAAGTYTVSLVATNGFGSSSPSTQTISVTATPTVTAAASPSTICSGQSTTLTGGGATNYTWAPGGVTTSTVSVSPTSPTTYTLTGTTGGCTNTRTVTVNVNATPTVTVNSPTICSGQSATLTASGAATYSWSTGPTTATLSVSPVLTTTYTVTGTTSGCNDPRTATVTVNATPTVTAVAASPTICSGQSTTLTGGGATNYTWQPGGTTTSTVNVAPTSPTTYTLTGSSLGCTATRTVSVSVNATPTVNATASAPTICAGQSTTLTGSGATNYTWMPGGATTTTVSVSPGSPTTYTLTGATGSCSATRTVAVNVIANPTITLISPNICAGQTWTLTASGATTYSWNTGAITPTISITPPSTTVYTVTGTTSGCSTVKTATVTVLSNPTVTVNSTTICSGTNATLTANGASNYTWSPGGVTTSTISVSPSSTTVYTVTGNTMGCSNVNTSTVTVNATPTVNVNSTTICSGNPGTLNASGATTYNWSPGTGLSATTGASVSANPGSTTVYTITGTTGSCSSSQTSTVTVVANLTVTVNSMAICVGATATLTASGASTYTWDTGSNSTSISVSPASTTVYTVTGSSGSCSNGNTATVTVNALPNVNATAGGTVCAGSAASLSASGATSYTWMPGGATGSPVIVNPTSTTIYTVTGDDGTCTNTATTTVNVNALPGIGVSAVQDTICVGNSTGITASGGISYNWSPGTGLSSTTNTTVVANPTITTTYTVTGTDNNGCANTAAIQIIVNGCTGLISTAGNMQLGVYPNPNHGSFVVNIPPGKVEYQLEMFNAIGELVYKDKLQAQSDPVKKIITLAPENKGVYLLNINSSLGKQVYRIIVE